MNLIERIGALGILKGDSEELKIQKGFLVYLAAFMSVGGLVWGSISIYYQLYFQSIFPYSYVLISMINMLYFSFSKSIREVRFVQVFISLALPFLFQWSLGGFSSSGVIMLWSILALIASLSFQSIETSFRWLWVYISLTLISAYFDSDLNQYKPDVLPDNSIIFVVINIILISSIVFGLVVYFVKKYKDAEVTLQLERDRLKKSYVTLRRSHDVLRKSYDKMRSKKEIIESQLIEKEVETQSSQLAEYRKVLQEQQRVLQDFEGVRAID